MEHSQTKPKLRFFLIGIIAVFFFSLTSIFSIHLHVEKSTKPQIYTQEQLAESGNDGYQAILILGGGIIKGYPTPMLKERLDTGIYLYNEGVAPKILMSGDNGSIHYDEVSAMRRYALEQGVPSEDIFMDYAGFSTYESIYRAEYIFGISKMIIVTQEYHLYRAIYIANSMDIDVVGVNATKNILSGHTARVSREFLAQTKDFFSTKLKPEPTFLGEKISLEQRADDVYNIEKIDKNTTLE